MKRFLYFVLVVGLVVSLAAACTPAAPATQAPVEPTAASVDTAKPTEAASAPEATTAAPAEKKSLVFAGPTDIASLDPRNANSTTTATILAHVYNSLMKTDENGKIINDLAESYKRVDDVTWEFKLKDGVTFHDGSKLTANDVKYTLDTIGDKEKKFRLTSDFSFIKAEVIDDLNVRLITDYPFQGLLLRLTYVKIIPKDYVEKVGDEEFNKTPIGSGPYKFVEWKKDDKVVLEVYEDYFEGRSAIDTVTYRVIPEVASRIAALESGEVDIIANVATSQVPRLKEVKGIEIVGNATTRVVFVKMNLLVDSFLKDLKVRQALNYAVDKQALIKGVLDGYGEQIATISTPQYEGYDASIPAFEYDPEKAKALLKEAGYENGFDMDFSLSVGLVNATDIAQAIAAQLGEVGINCNVIVEDAAQLREKIAAGTVSALYLEGIGGPYANIDLIAKLSFSTGERYSTYSTPEFDELRLKAASEVDPQKTLELQKELQQYMVDHAPAIFLYQQFSIYAYNADRVVNWLPRVDEMVVATAADIK